METTIHIHPIENHDSEAFISVIESITNNVIRAYLPEKLILIQLKSWFGSRWLGFSGKRSGIVGVWLSKLTIPPFVPSRILSQRRFSAPIYAEVDPSPPLHKKLSSGEALSRRITTLEPATAILWYSGDSKSTGHGSAMAYIPRGDCWTCWYASWSHRVNWKVEEIKGINLQELLLLAHPSAAIFSTNSATTPAS